MRYFTAAACVAALIGILGGAPSRAHEGHDHGAAQPPVSATIAPRAEASTEALELVAVAQGGELVIYLDAFATNAPVTNASVEVETPEGAKAAAPSGDAYRLAAPWLAKIGKYDLIVTVTHQGAVEVLPVTLEVTREGASASGTKAARLPLGLIVGASIGVIALGALGIGWARHRRRASFSALLLLSFTLAAPVFAHEGEDHSKPTAAPALAAPAAAAAPSRDLPQRLGDGSIFVPKAAQRLFGVRTILTSEGVFPRTLELPGRIIPDPNASGLVQAAVGGRLSPPEGGFPKLGTRVAKGDVLAYVTPPLQAIDVSDMRQRQGELDQQIGIVQKRVVRYEALVPSGAVARVQLDEARLELQGLKDRRAALEKSRSVPEGLVSPVDGIIADGTVVAGQIAPSNMVVYHVVDPQRLWIEALSFHALSGAKQATARTAEGRSVAITFQGSGFADRNQSVPVQFAVTGDTSGLRVGQFVLVQASTDDEEKGMAVPRASVVRIANGQDVVFEHVAAERFVPRPVRTAPLDGSRVLIVSGVANSVRIVTEGAELLDQVR